jgi:hypothetical protein
MPMPRSSGSRSRSGSSAMRPITPSRMAATLLATAMMPAASISACADEIRVISSNALKPVLEQIAPEFENATGHKLVFTWGQAEILKGTSLDLAVLTAGVIDKLIMQGTLIGDPQGGCSFGGRPCGPRGGGETRHQHSRIVQAHAPQCRFNYVRRAGRNRRLSEGAVSTAWHR